MREIGFRAILKREKTFREVWGVDFYNQKVLVNIGGSNEWHSWKILSEFTGFYDKNDKKIYEGDIVDVSYDFGDRWGWIEYLAPAFFIKTITGNHLGFRNIWQGSLEIIGNKWENPELLRKK